MAVDVQIPTLGESISDGVIVRWMKRDGETVAADEPLLELETDKASVEIPAPTAGVISVIAKEGQTVKVGEVVARIEPNGSRTASAGAAPKPSPPESMPGPAPAAPPPPQPTAAPAAGNG